MKVRITVTPVKGEPRTAEVDVTEGTSVADALKQVDGGTKGFNLFLNGEPVKPDTKIDGKILTGATEIAISATERAAGS